MSQREIERFSKIRTLKVLCFSRVEKRERERALTTVKREKRRAKCETESFFFPEMCGEREIQRKEEALSEF